MLTPTIFSPSAGFPFSLFSASASSFPLTSPACVVPEENRERLYNTRLVEDFGATVETCPVTEVSGTIDRRMEAFRQAGRNPYFIMGGGHGNPGTRACVNTYREIAAYEEQAGISFDYIFHASGTGTTQAGLVSGKLLADAEKREKGKPADPSLVL